MRHIMIYTSSKGSAYMDKCFLIVGGDLRQLYAASFLSEFARVYTVGFERSAVDCPKNVHACESLLSIPERLDWVILPIPASYDGIAVNAPYSDHNLMLEHIPQLVKAEGVVFGGRIDSDTRDLFGEHGISVSDITEREEFSVLNAVPTAEGAIQLAMEEMPVTIFGREVLVTGMGRISKVLCRTLNAMGAKVSVAVRKYSDMAWAKIYGCTGIHMSDLSEKLSSFELIFNTVPTVIFSDKHLVMLKDNVLIIDLASKPGGLDFDAAGQLGIKVIWALSLPGKVAPITSGEIIASSVLNIINERGLANEDT